MKNTKKQNIDILFIDYGVIEEALVMYKIGRINLDEAKRLIKIYIDK